MSLHGQALNMPPSPCKAATGLTEAELACVVAVASCPPSMQATRESIRQVTGGFLSLPSLLVERGVLRRLDVPGRMAVYGVRPEWARSLGLPVAETDRA